LPYRADICLHFARAWHHHRASAESLLHPQRYRHDLRQIRILHLLAPAFPRLHNRYSISTACSNRYENSRSSGLPLSSLQISGLGRDTPCIDWSQRSSPLMRFQLVLALAALAGPALAQEKDLSITFVGQACFALRTDGGATVIADPPADSIGYTLPSIA